jgi:hypothetical protein
LLRLTFTVIPTRKFFFPKILIFLPPMIGSKK